MAQVKKEDIANAVAVIGQWTGAVVAELLAGDSASDMKEIHQKVENSNPGYKINSDSSIATQISALGAGIGKTC